MENYTKKAIQSKLMEMLETTPADKITVTSVVDACDMNRNTFYYHFKDFDSLLRSTLTDLFTSTLNACAAEDEKTCGLAMAMGRLTERVAELTNIFNTEKSPIMTICLEDMAEDAVNAWLDRRSPNGSSSREGREIAGMARIMFSGLMLDWLLKPADKKYDLRALVDHAWNRLIW